MRLASISVVVAAVAIVWTRIEAAATPSRASCAANVVRYQAAKHPTLHDVPWILARPTTRGVLGFVVSREQTLRDRRVNGSDGLVLWTTGARIVWSGPSLPGTLVAQRLDGKGSFRVGLVTTDDGLVSELRFPSAGCWRLRLGSATAVVRVVSRPGTLDCAATPLRRGGAFARPLSSGIRGGWGPWRTPTGGALLYTHGHGAGWNMKVLWRVLRHSDSALTLTGIRLDGDGSFSQTFGMVYEGVFPSTVDVPAPGCWLLRLRTARLAGVLVVRAVDDRG